MSNDKLQRQIDDHRVEGWKVLEETGDSRAVLVRRRYGTLPGHAIIFLLLGWWTLGLANLLYIAYKYFFDAEKKVVRVGE